MFEPKTFADQRVGMLEYLLNNTIEVFKASQGPGSALSQQMDQVQQQWVFYNVNARRRWAAQTLGVPTTPSLDPNIASTGWIDTILRANYAIIEICGNGYQNPLPTVEGNDVAVFGPWLAGLPQAQEVVNERSPACFFQDDVNSNGLPVLLIPDMNGPHGSFLHIIVLFGQISVQSLSIDHLPVDWNWDNHDWHTEVFGYLNLMSRETFLRGLAEAIKNSGRGGETPTLYIPNNYPMMPEELRDAQKLLDLELANRVTAGLDVAVEVIDLVVRDVAAEREAIERIAAEENIQLPANDDVPPAPDTQA